MEFCEKSGITMSELERRADVTPGTFKTWHRVKDPGKIDAKTIISLAKVMGVSPEELIEVSP